MTNDVDEWFNDLDDSSEESIDAVGAEEESEDVDLAILGISLELADQFRSYYKNKNIFYGGKLTKQFFEWILKSCNEWQLSQIKKEYKRYTPEFQAMIEEATPHNLGKEEPTWNKDFLEIKSEIGYLRQYLRFLYALLGRINESASYEFNEEEIKMIEKIDEVVQK